MEKKIKILAIAGSLRKQSYNRSLIQAALEIAPSDSSLEIFDLAGIPLYNQDEENNLPPAVAALKAKVRAADAILIATPEYNYSMPGVLKNALDWGSRPYGDSAWDNKPVAIMGTSPGMQGTSRAQYHLRQVFVYLNMHPLNKPELMIGSASDKFDARGNLTDPKTREKIGELLAALVACAKQRSLKGP
jgi:chromate reductase, NAD(P)H dehydrogenase (quinone)